MFFWLLCPTPRSWRCFLLALLCEAFCAAPVTAGAPFTTDDPQTPPQAGFEFDLVARLTDRRDDISGALPSLEIDYGLTARLALHLLVATAFDQSAGEAFHMGSGDTELGAKFRFLDQGEHGSPVALAAYPIVTAPTGDRARGLGSGRTRLLLPLWLQREEDEWRVFGGGGYWINPGADNRDFVFLGLGVLRRVSEVLSLGAEIYHATADTVAGQPSTGMNFGAIYDVSPQHHLMVSAGRALVNAASTNRLSLFVGYQLTP